MTIEQLLDVVQTILGISLHSANFPDLETSCRPSLSLTIERIPQIFKLKLAELTEEQRSKLQLWIQLIWKDKVQTEGRNYDGTNFLSYRLHTREDLLQLKKSPQAATLERMEAIIQETMWRSVSRVNC